MNSQNLTQTLRKSSAPKEWPELMNDVTAALYLGVHPSFLRRRRCYVAGVLTSKGPTYYKLGRKVLYRRSDLDEYVAKSAR